MDKRATVLVVEDEFAITELLDLILTDQGYEVIIANNGKQGLERLSAGPLPDLVISDFMMPIMDGISMIQAMREMDLERDIPCIVMSAMPEANIRGRIDGFAAFVRKPFHLDALVRLVATILSRRRPKLSQD